MDRVACNHSGIGTKPIVSHDRWYVGHDGDAADHVGLIDEENADGEV